MHRPGRTTRFLCLVVAVATLPATVRVARAQDAPRPAAPPAASDPKAAEGAAETQEIERELAAADESLKAKKPEESAAHCKTAVASVMKSSLPTTNKVLLLRHASYDLACALALGGKPEQREPAVKAVEDLLRLGYDNLEHLEWDPWLESLHGLDSWKKLLESAKAARAARPKTAPAPAPAPPPATPAPAAVGGQEWLSPELYRAPEGQATVALPDLGAEWTVEPREGGAVFTLGKTTAWKARITLFVYPRDRFATIADTDEALATNVARAVAADLKKTNAWLTSNPELATRSHKLATCTETQVLLEGTERPQQDYEVAVSALVRGKVAAELTLVSLKASAKEAVAVLEKIAPRVRLGDAVPRLPKHDPGTGLEGVYLGPYETLLGLNNTLTGTQRWFVFERGGYATEADPESDVQLDMEMLYQSGSREVYSYKVTAGKLILQPFSGGKQEERTLKIDGRRLEIDGKKYDRVDGRYTDGLTIQGAYSTVGMTSASSSSTQQFSFHSSSSYSFGADGTFRSAHTASATLANGSGSPQVNSGAIGNDHGTYAIKGDRIVFSYGNGTRLARTFYPGELEVSPEVKFTRKLFYIGGTSYLKD